MRKDMRIDLQFFAQGPVNSPEDKPVYGVCPHDRVTDALAQMSSRKAQKNKYGELYIEKSGVKCEFGDLMKNPQSAAIKAFGIGAHKLLTAGLICFAEKNPMGSKSPVQELRVYIPLKEYAMSNGYDVEPRSSTEAEKKRAESELKNARKKIKADINVLMDGSFTYEEKGRKHGNWGRVSILGAGAITNRHICLEFTATAADLFKRMPLTQYPLCLLKVDERKPNVYRLGLKLSERYYMDSNQMKGTAQILSVKSLLNVLDLPAIESLRRQKLGWEERIKDRLEEYLETLISETGLLEEWHYCYSGGEMLSDEDAVFDSFESWSEARIYFRLKNPVDHRPRLETKEKKKRGRPRKQVLAPKAE